MDKAAPILIDNAEEWEAGQILDYCRQNNRNEFRDHWKPYERADHSWEHIKNLDHSMELIQQYWDGNMCTCSGNGTQERAVQDLLCLVGLYLVYLL